MSKSRLVQTLRILLLVTVTFVTVAVAQQSIRLVPHRITLASGKSYTLNLAEGFEINVAAEGLKRVRFMAKSPDNRIFVTDMFNLTDNRRGVVYILGEFNEITRHFRRVIPYLSGLRNPNSVAFYTDSQGTQWFYLALTDRLVRYRYEAGANRPTTQPEVLATFPDYGLGYKYGGWHLTRTIAFGPSGKLYVSVGSSCNACEEKEEIRATIVEMDPDGKNQRFFARGLRNAVGLRLVGARMFATNMGADHLGRDKPADTMIVVSDSANYGWPYCYQTGERLFIDEKLNPRGSKFDCRSARSATTAFPAHSSPLGLEYFGADADAALRDSFLVALHGSTTKSLNRGYKVIKVSSDGKKQEDFLTGFINRGIVHGRPVDIFRVDPSAFFVTDDRAGVVYYISKR